MSEKPLYKIVQCSLCDKEMTITHLARHMKEIHNTKRVKCYICPKSFKRKEKLINHLRNIHDIQMLDIKRNLLKEVDVQLPKNNKIKPRLYKRKMVQLRVGENFDGVLNSNQIHSEYIKDKILEDDTHDRRKYLNMSLEEIKELRKHNRATRRLLGRRRAALRKRHGNVKYEEDEEDDFDDDDDDDDDDEEISDDDLDDSELDFDSDDSSSEDSEGITRVPTSETNQLLLDFSDDDIEPNDSSIETNFNPEFDGKPKIPYEVFEKVRLVSYQISNEIGNSKLTLTFHFLTKFGKPLTVHLLREHEIKLFFNSAPPTAEFFDRLKDIIENIELIESICVTNGEIITTENYGFRYKTFCWTTIKDFTVEEES